MSYYAGQRAEITGGPAGLGDLQDMLNKLPWRKDAREKREARQAFRVQAIEEEAQEIEAQGKAQVSRDLWAVGAAAVVGLGVVWWLTR